MAPQLTPDQAIRADLVLLIGDTVRTILAAELPAAVDFVLESRRAKNEA